MKLLALIDGKAPSLGALDAAATLAQRLNAELGVVTVRSGTHATEAPPPVGVDIPAAAREGLPDGIRRLLEAADRLAAAGRLVPLESLRVRDLPHGYLFLGRRPDGAAVPFSERFGGLVDELNREIADGGYDLVVVASPRRGALGRFAPMNVPRKLALDLQASFLVVRGGAPEGRYVVCADGSPSSRRIFPFFQKLLPAIAGPIDLVCAHTPDADPEGIARAERCLRQAEGWLTRCGKTVRVARLRGPKRYRMILEAAGREAVIVMGESHLHDVRRRTLGSLPLKVLPRTDASFLLVKQPNDPDPELFEGTLTCG